MSIGFPPIQADKHQRSGHDSKENETREDMVNANGHSTSRQISKKNDSIDAQTVCQHWNNE